MSTISYNLQFNKLCSSLHLGKLTGEPEQVAGGLLHRMYKLETDTGRYAIKALNPQIMLRPVALQNYIYSEEIANIAARKVPALPAKQLNGDTLQNLDGQYYLIFDWIEGRSLQAQEINKDHCAIVGDLLAGIHLTDFSERTIPKDDSHPSSVTNWSQYAQLGQEQSAVWYSLLSDQLEQLYKWESHANQAADQLNAEQLISHRDLDPKNIMWHHNEPVIIDWEAAGYIHPMQDLVETAIYWAENEAGDVDKEKFLAVLDGYQKRGGTLTGNWQAVLHSGFLGKLGWLAYNLKRSLSIECTDEAEQRLGTAQVIDTIHAMTKYADMVLELENWLHTSQS